MKQGDPAAAGDRIVSALVVLLGIGGAALGWAMGAAPAPVAWRTALLLVALAAVSRPLGIPLPGKGYTSFVVGLASAAVVLLGWAPGALAAAVGMLLGDLLLRRGDPVTVLVDAGHLATGCIAAGLLYTVAGGVYGTEALTLGNAPALLLLLVAAPVLVNATFYLRLKLSAELPWVDPRLTLRWEAAVSVLGMVLAVGLLALVAAARSSLGGGALAAGWVGFATLAHWLVRRGVEGEALLLVQRLARAVGARPEFLQAFEDVKRLTGALVPWDDMGIAAYDAGAREFVVLADTSPDTPRGRRFSADEGLVGEALERGVPLTDRGAGRFRRRGGGQGSQIVVPLSHGERLVGVWNVRHADDRMYRASDAELLGHAAPQLALSLSLDALVRPMLEASELTAQQAQSITASTKQLHAAARESADHARSVADTVLGLAEALASGASQAEEARAVAEESADRGEATRKSGQEMVETARNVRDATAAALTQLRAAADTVQQGAEQVARLHEVSGTVERFRQTITELADQSGLLALNAAIEAARAGEYGRSFGIVADEIRTLADRSAAEAESARAGVQEIRDTLQRTIELMEQTQEEVLAVAEASGRWVGELDAIVAAAEAVAETGQRIASTARETARRSAATAALLQEAGSDADRAATDTDAVAEAGAAQESAITELDRAADELAATAQQLAAAAAAVREGRDRHGAPGPAGG